MKSYEEITNDLLSRRDRYAIEQSRKRKRVMRAAISLCCCCLVAFIGFGILQGNKGASTIPPVASKQPNNAVTPDHTMNPTIEPTIGNSGNTDATIWMTADEVLESADIGTQMGVAVPMLITYEGAIYGCFGEESIENSQYAPLGNDVILRKHCNYTYPAYQIKGVPDNVAIIINGRLEIYQKLFEVNATINGTTYRVAHPMGYGNEYACGEIVQENEDFTIYRAINTQSGEIIESEYLINILPLLKSEYPTMFDGNENYGDAWWVAAP